MVTECLGRRNEFDLQNSLEPVNLGIFKPRLAEFVREFCAAMSSGRIANDRTAAQTPGSNRLEELTPG
jgi:hypothetical protein